MPLPIGCESLDKLLHGGIDAKVITLIYGEAGSGKTNVCLQLARNVCLQNRKVIYIDTEGVSLERLEQICGDDFKNIVKNILFSEPYSFNEQEKMVDKAARLAEGSANIGLIILDTATMHYRLTRTDEEKGERKSLTTQLIKLLSIARKKNIPVVLTSQVYTDIDKGTYEPLGGHALLHNAKVIIRLEKIGQNLRRAVVMKHQHLAEGRSAEFKLTGRGVES